MMPILSLGDILFAIALGFCLARIAGALAMVFSEEAD